MSLRFEIRPTPVLPEHRPLLKIAQVLLVLEMASRGAKSSLPRLQLFNWALKSPERISVLRRAAETGRLETVAWGFDPALPIALRFAVAENLIQDVPSGYEMTDKGRAYVSDAVRRNLLDTERAALAPIGKKITEAMTNEVARRWGA
jgi:hypothetical protein